MTGILGVNWNGISKVYYSGSEWLVGLDCAMSIAEDVYKSFFLSDHAHITFSRQHVQVKAADVLGIYIVQFRCMMQRTSKTPKHIGTPRICRTLKINLFVRVSNATSDTVDEYRFNATSFYRKHPKTETDILQLTPHKANIPLDRVRSKSLPSVE